MRDYKDVGTKLSAYIRVNHPTTQQIQGFLGDLLADDDLLLIMKDVVARPSFSALKNLAGSGKGTIQREALLRELSRSYLPSLVDSVGVLISGMISIDQCKQVLKDDAPQGPTSSRQILSLVGTVVSLLIGMAMVRCGLLLRPVEMDSIPPGYSYEGRFGAGSDFYSRLNRKVDGVAIVDGYRISGKGEVRSDLAYAINCFRSLVRWQGEWKPIEKDSLAEALKRRYCINE